jgi:hypothetical protein
MPRWLTRFSIRSPIPLRPLPPTAPTIRTRSARRLPSVIQMLPSSCHHERGAVASVSSETAPTQRDRHLRMIAERGRMAWQKASSYNLRAKVEASIGRYKRVIGDALRSRNDQTEATEVAIAAAALNRMLGLGRPNYVRIG